MLIVGLSGVSGEDFDLDELDVLDYDMHQVDRKNTWLNIVNVFYYIFKFNFLLIYVITFGIWMMHARLKLANIFALLT